MILDHWGCQTSVLGQVHDDDGRVQQLDAPADALGFARACRAEADAAEAGLLLAGEGAPLVAELCLAEFAAALGVSTDAGRALVAEALELKHRLPRTWARVGGGELPASRARRVAATRSGSRVRPRTGGT